MQTAPAPAPALASAEALPRCRVDVRAAKQAIAGGEGPWSARTLRYHDILDQILDATRYRPYCVATADPETVELWSAADPAQPVSCIKVPRRVITPAEHTVEPAAVSQR